LCQDFATRAQGNCAARRTRTLITTGSAAR
jgi:hypothetical protein